jgi:hypothetical protein
MNTEIRVKLRQLGIDRPERVTLGEMIDALDKHFKNCKGCDLELSQLSIYITKLWLERVEL